MYSSILDQVTFLSVEENESSLYVRAIKVKDGEESFYERELSKNSLQQSKEELAVISSFLENIPVVVWNYEEMNSLFHGCRLKNKILSILELVAVLEPWRKDFIYKNVMQDLIQCKKSDIDIHSKVPYNYIVLVNSILCRHWTREEKNRRDLYKDLRVLSLNTSGWEWTDYLLRPIMFSFENYTYVDYDEQPKEKTVLKKIDIEYEKYEKLLQEKDIWNNGGDFHYVYRKDQEKMAEQIRNTIKNEKRIFIEAPTGSGKTFAYLLIVSIASYLNRQSRNAEERSFIISTDTKELQNQLIEKDIPNILKKLGLSKKVKYGAMKGKANYICAERLEKCEEFNDEKNGLLSYLFLKSLSQEGTYGDIEKINYWAYEYFNIDKYKHLVTCDSEKCDLDKCSKKCYLKNRYNELPLDNITVINHSLLASWPYGEKKKISNLIIDEAHNLMEKGYDYFTEEFDALEFLKLIKEIDEGTPSIVYMLNKLNALYNYKEQIDRNLLKERARDIEFNIVNMLNEFRRIGLHNDEYDFTDEFYNAEEENKVPLESIKEPLSVLKASIYSLYKVIFTYVNNIVYDEKDSGSEYRVISLYMHKLKLGFDIIDSFLTFSKDYAKIITINHDFNNFSIKNTPLNIGDLVNEKILGEVKSTVFISATLKINNSFDTVKKILGQEEADDYVINPVFNLKRRTKIFIAKDIGSYKEKSKYIKNSAKFIFDLSKEINGHILVLFNNNNRRELVKKELAMLIENTDIEVHTSKKAISVLKDKNRKAIILGTKGFFEGIDLPGDALRCVVFDKIPNVNPKDPLFKAMRSYQNSYYRAYNYPKLCIKMKQGYGRLVRSIFDYGYFIILDGGTNRETIVNMERDLGGPIINSINSELITANVKRDNALWQRENLRMILRTMKKEEIKHKFDDTSRKSHLFWRYREDLSLGNEYIFTNGEIKVKVRYDNE